MAGDPLATNGRFPMATDKRFGDRLDCASAPDGELHNLVPHLSRNSWHFPALKGTLWHSRPTAAACIAPAHDHFCWRSRHDSNVRPAV